MKIAVDFDGTIVEHKYPEIGKTVLFAFEALKELQKRKHKIILWTFRIGKRLEEAVEFCKKNGVDFYAVNKSFQEEIFNETDISRKIDADLFIDDRNLNGFPGWAAVLHALHPEAFGIEDEPEGLLEKFKSFFERIKS